MTQTVWRPNPFAEATAKLEATKEARLIRLVQRRGMVTRKEMMKHTGVCDGKPLYQLMEKAGVVVVGHTTNKTGGVANLYGFKA